MEESVGKHPSDALAGGSRPAGASYLGRPFDQYQNMMQIARCIREASRQLGIARPRLLEVHRRETGLREYLPEIEIETFASHDPEGRPTLGAPVSLPFGDAAFDACLVTDAYEHIAREQRSGLLGEMLRVTRGLVLLGCPMDDGIVSRLDKVVFDFIWGKYAERFAPLEQHIEFGLEPLAAVLARIEGQGAKAIALPCNYVYRWIHQILIYFDLQHRQPHADLFEPLNRIYNERVSPFDYREPCYRYLIAVATDDRLDSAELERALTRPPETGAIVGEAEGALIEAFHAIDDRANQRLEAAARETERLRQRIRELEDERDAHATASMRSSSSRAQGLIARTLRRLWHPATTS